MPRDQVFVSYSHADSDYLARLKIHIRPFEREGLVELWSDARIKPGHKWKAEIAKAIDRAAVAILLVSADFLASDFVAENELPPLLEAAAKDGVRILPVILKPCAFPDIASLSHFQAFNDPKAPLIGMKERSREALWSDVARAAKDQLAEFTKRNAQAKPAERSANIGQPALMRFGDNIIAGLFGEELSNPERIDEFVVYQYTFLDELAYMPRAVDVLGSEPEFEAVLARIKERFRLAGWEGDGEIQLMWIPPFVGAGVEDTWGLGVWHVKQRNNGVSWLASPVALPFARLLEQNT